MEVGPEICPEYKVHNSTGPCWLEEGVLDPRGSGSVGSCVVAGLNGINKFIK